jgi:hypothetical protein
VRVEAGEAIADIGGDDDGAADLAGGQRRFKTQHQVADGAAVFAALEGASAKVVADPACGDDRHAAQVGAEAALPPALRGLPVAEGVADAGGGVDHVGAQRVAGGTGGRSGALQPAVAGAAGATVVGNPGQHPAGIGLAGLHLRQGVGRQGVRLRAAKLLAEEQRVFGLVLGGIELALQPFGFGGHQQQAGAQQGSLGGRQQRQQRRDLGGQVLRAQGITLAMMPGKRRQQRQSRQTLLFQQQRIQPRQLFVERKHVHQMTSLAVYYPVPDRSGRRHCLSAFVRCYSIIPQFTGGTITTL